MTVSHPTKYLSEWFIRYSKNRDLAFRKIASIREEENKVFVEQKDGKVIEYAIEPFPADVYTITQSISSQNKGLVVYNTQENLDVLLKSWKNLISMNDLTIYFVNPFSKTDKRWIINPRTHSLISDSASLKQGLMSMYMTVDPTTKEEIEKLTK